MTKKVIKKSNKLQKIVLGALVIAGATGLYMNHAKAADLLYMPKAPHVGFVDESGWYIAGHGGADFGDDFSGVSFDTGYNFSGAVGYDFGQIGLANLRTEAEVGFLSSDANNIAPFTGSVDATYAFLNAYADFGKFNGFTPFIGGGVGYASVNGEVSVPGFTVQANDKDFAYNLTAGVSYDLTQRISLDVAYRYLAIPDVTFSAFGGSVTDDVNIHQVNAGLRLKL